MRRRVNVWGNLISMHLEPNESEPNAFEGRADSSINPKICFYKKCLSEMSNHPSVLYYTESGPMTSTESSMHMTFHFATSWASRKLKIGGFLFQ